MLAAVSVDSLAVSESEAKSLVRKRGETRVRVPKGWRSERALDAMYMSSLSVRVKGVFGSVSRSPVHPS